MSSSDDDEEVTILEEYKLWRKNCRYMYDFISETALTWPSLSVAWVPGGAFSNKTKDNKYSVVRNLFLTTHTSIDTEPDYLKVASVQLPRSIFPDGKELTPEELETVNSRLKITAKFEVDSEINRVRSMPQDPKTVATINGEGSVVVEEFNEQLEVNKSSKLSHHKENGFGLCWNPVTKGELLTCSDDHSVAYWQYEGADTAPKNVFTNHTDIVNDVRWHKSGLTFGSVGEDKKFVYQDKRATEASIDTVLTEKTSFNTLAFSGFDEYLFALGGQDSNVYLYDLRNTSQQLHAMLGHTKPITNLEWDPFHDNIVASSSEDRRIILWDIDKIGEEQQPDEVEDGVPELLMMHGGHTGGVNDFQFSQEVPWCIASCSDDNIVHLWKVSKKVLEENGEKGYSIDVNLDDLE